MLSQTPTLAFVHNEQRVDVRLSTPWLNVALTLVATVALFVLTVAIVATSSEAEAKLDRLADAHNVVEMLLDTAKYPPLLLEKTFSSSHAGSEASKEEDIERARRTTPALSNAVGSTQLASRQQPRHWTKGSAYSVQCLYSLQTPTRTVWLELRWSLTPTAQVPSACNEREKERGETTVNTTQRWIGTCSALIQSTTGSTKTILTSHRPSRSALARLRQWPTTATK